MEYIDFAAENGWDYVCLDVGWRAIEGRLKGLCDYAASKNVGIFVWINYRDMKELSEIDRFGDETADNENYTYYEAESSNTLRGTAAATIFPLPFRK